MFLEVAFLIAGYAIGSLVTAAAIFYKHQWHEQEWHLHTQTDVQDMQSGIEAVFIVGACQSVAPHANRFRTREPANDQPVSADQGR